MTGKMMPTAGNPPEKMGKFHWLQYAFLWCSAAFSWLVLKGKLVPCVVVVWMSLKVDMAIFPNNVFWDTMLIDF